MHFRLSALAAALTVMLLPASAGAATHLVAVGETLSGIAAANGLSTQSLAAANGLPADAYVIAGRTLEIPAPGTAPAASAVSAQTASEPAPLGGYRVRLGDTLSAIAAEHGVSLEQLAAANGLDPTGVLVVGTSLRLPTPGAAPVSPGAPSTSTSGGRLVNPGETLWGIAMANGVTPAALAAANGLDPEAHVIAGTHLTIPSGASAAAPAATPSGSVPAASGGRLDGTTIGQIAAAEGAPSALAQAIAWQESGFNNDMVSVANARGIMQVMPATWDYVQHNLTSSPLDPNSPADNVRAGSLLLGQLLRQTGDPATAVAAYYQGLGSVQRIGMLPETQQYVANVMALQQRFGG
ncbi:MAG TPA: LysM peptidoglycan-binding domain-containing protein [Baekduia sp.]|nr:LysM peptidoglycan-binding domain-containing protein [Baekduia sp.]